ncbi:MAG: hypothetical protein GC162_09950 [Planctomycetes bacterium]|nr:hypothetical protein [Planctomycetota bacterium]
MTEREIIKIAVSPKAKAAIESMCQRYGMSQVELASRLYLWLSEQDELIQTAVLGILPESVAPDIAAMVLRKLAGESGTPAGRSAKAARTSRRSVHVTTRLPDETPKRQDRKDE